LRNPRAGAATGRPSEGQINRESPMGFLLIEKPKGRGGHRPPVRRTNK
jgi:hypothetical protein